MAEPKSILVVEDDIDVCNAIVTTLAQNGYRPTGCSSAREANFKLKNQKFACILLDMRLGNETGEHVIEFVRHRKESQNLGTPVLVVSGSLDKDLILKIAGQIQGAIVKPFDQKDLLSLVSKLIGPA
jgi:DNA-binding response OmpR family regulator